VKNGDTYKNSFGTFNYFVVDTIDAQLVNLPLEILGHPNFCANANMGGSGVSRGG